MKILLIVLFIVVSCNDRLNEVQKVQDYSKMNREQLLKAYDSLFALTDPDDPLRYRYTKETIQINGKDSIFIIDNCKDGSH